MYAIGKRVEFRVLRGWRWVGVGFVRVRGDERRGSVICFVVGCDLKVLLPCGAGMMGIGDGFRRGDGDEFVDDGLTS